MFNSKNFLFGKNNFAAPASALVSSGRDSGGAWRGPGDENCFFLCEGRRAGDLWPPTTFLGG